jgi:CHAT domain-containing protein/predicted negative regulator of RcsB-dependent stress response
VRSGLMAWLLLVLLASSCGARDGAQPPRDASEDAWRSFREGKLDSADEKVKRNLATCEQSHNDCHWDFRLLGIEVIYARGNAKQALTELEKAGSPPDGAPMKARYAIIHAKILGALGNYGAAHARLGEARIMLASTPLAAASLEADLVEGATYWNERNYEQANIFSQRALDQAVTLHDAYFQAAALNNLGLSRFARSRFDDAVPYFERALTAAREYGAERWRGNSLLNLGICLYRLGDLERSRTMLDEALEVNRKIQDQRRVMLTLGEIGNLYTLQRDPQKAIENYEQAYGTAKELGLAPSAGLWAGNLSNAWINLQNWDEAAKWNDIGKDLKIQSGDSKSLVRTSLNAAHIARGRGLYDEAAPLYAAVIKEADGDPILLWETNAGLGDLYARKGDTAKAGRQYETALGYIESSQANLLRVEFKLSYLSNLILFYERYVDLLNEQGQHEKALDVAESSRARILLGIGKTARRDYRELAKRSKTTFLAYWLSPGGSSLWLVSPRQIRYFELPPADRIEELVRSYRNALLNLRDPLNGEAPAGQKLYELLVAPAQALIPPHSSVTLVLDGALHGVNFETLINGDHYWLEDVIVSVTPSLRVAAALPVQAATAKSMLMIGDAEANGTAFPKLPRASEEIDAIGKALASYSQTVYRGPQATPRVYRDAKPERFSLIHFAAHADANPESPLESSVVLSAQPDGFKLYAADIKDVPLNADLVTLSSCRSAGARSYAGEGPIGLAWAFLHAGSRNVIAGLWDVNDASTARLMEAFYGDVAAGHDYRSALRTAKLSLLHSSYRKPFYWAPFQIYTREL